MKYLKKQFIVFENYKYQIMNYRQSILLSDESVLENVFVYCVDADPQKNKLLVVTVTNLWNTMLELKINSHEYKRQIT